MHHFGVLIPSTNRTVEIEYNRLLPASLQAHAARIPLLPEGAGDDDAIALQARMLASARVEAISLAQTSATLAPLDRDEALVGRIVRETGVAAVTSAQAIGQALAALGARRIAIVSPYALGVLEQARGYYEGKFGLEVVATEGFSGAATFTYAALGPELARAAIERADRAGIEALVLPGGNFPTMAHVAGWEAAFGKPVVTTNGAALWAMMRLMKDDTPLPGLGRLLEGGSGV